jgi:hypothetical protein
MEGRRKKGDRLEDEALSQTVVETGPTLLDELVACETVPVRTHLPDGSPSAPQQVNAGSGAVNAGPGAVNADPGAVNADPGAVAKVIALFNHKGGVGKTTSTLSLGWKLAETGKRVLLIDADPQCSLTGTLVDPGCELFGDVFDDPQEAFYAVRRFLLFLFRTVADIYFFSHQRYPTFNILASLAPLLGDEGLCENSAFCLVTGGYCLIVSLLGTETIFCRTMLADRNSFRFPIRCSCLEGTLIFTSMTRRSCLQLRTWMHIQMLTLCQVALQSCFRV